jgi:hypothetical protein
MSGSIVPALTRRDAGPPYGTEASYAQAYAFSDDCSSCPSCHRRLLLLPPSSARVHPHMRSRVRSDVHAGQPVSAGTGAGARGSDSRAASRGVDLPAGQRANAGYSGTGSSATPWGERL